MVSETKSIFVAAVIAAITAGAVAAQTTTFDNQGAAADAVSDLEEQIEDDADREVPTFGNAGRALGFEGSLALRGTMTTGNSDSADLGVGANFGYYDGMNGYDLALAFAYGETDGMETENRLLYGVEYTRDISDAFYGFAQVQGSSDDYASFVSDTFAGAGVGYRVVNTPDVQFSAQAGLGYRWATLADDSEIEEEAVSLSTNYSNRLTQTVLLTMDTDAIISESDTVVINDLGLNVSMTDTLALRTSVVTEYHTDPLPGDVDTDNTFGVSLVYSFN